MTDARRGWLKEELEEVHNEVATWPAWKRGETMSQDAQREPVREATRYDPCPLCTASRPRLCDLHYQQEVDAFLETVKQAIASPRTPGGVKAAYEELLAQNRALSDRLAESEAKTKYLADFVYAEEGVFTYPDGETISCRRGSTYEQLKQRLAAANTMADTYYHEREGLKQQVAQVKELEAAHFTELKERLRYTGEYRDAKRKVEQLVTDLDAARQDAARLREAALWAMKKVKRLSTRAVDYKRADDFIQHEEALKGA